MPQNSPVIKCRKPECPVNIRMLLYLKSGKPAPIEVDPSPDGNIHIDLDQGTYIILSGEELANARARGIELRLNHFASCKFAREFSRKPSVTSAPAFRLLEMAATEVLIIDQVRGIIRAGEAKVCATCRNSLTYVRQEPDGYRCTQCLAKICVVCGCTEERACPGGCSWAGPGLCSTHLAELEKALTTVVSQRGESV